MLGLCFTKFSIHSSRDASLTRRLQAARRIFDYRRILCNLWANFLSTIPICPPEPKSTEPKGRHRRIRYVSTDTALDALCVFLRKRVKCHEAFVLPVNNEFRIVFHTDPLVGDDTWSTWMTPGSAQQLTLEGACGLTDGLP